MIRVDDSSVTHLGNEDDVKSIITCMTEANDGRAKTMTMAMMIPRRHMVLDMKTEKYE